MHRKALGKHGWSVVSGLLLSVPLGLPAHAAPSNSQAQLAIGSPLPNALVGGRITLSVAYGTGSTPITAFTVLVDDAIQFSRPFNGSGNGVNYLDLDTRTIPDGNHVIKVVANGLRGQIAFEQVKITVKNGVAGGPDVVPPLVQFRGLTDGQEVSGVVDLDLLAEDNVTTRLLVTFFVNQDVKLIKNVPPYLLRLDTSKYLDPKTGTGLIKLEAWAFDDARNKGMARPLTLKVVRPNGEHTPFKGDPAQPIPVPGPRPAGAPENRTLPMGEEPQPISIPLPSPHQPLGAAAHDARVGGEPITTPGGIHEPRGVPAPLSRVASAKLPANPVGPDFDRGAPESARSGEGPHGRLRGNQPTAVRQPQPAVTGGKHGTPQPREAGPIAATTGEGSAATGTRVAPPSGVSALPLKAASTHNGSVRGPGNDADAVHGEPSTGTARTHQPGEATHAATPKPAVAPVKPTVAPVKPAVVAARAPRPVAPVVKPILAAKPTPAAKPAPAPAVKPVPAPMVVAKAVPLAAPQMDVRMGDTLEIPMALPVPTPGPLRETMPSAEPTARATQAPAPKPTANGAKVAAVPHSSAAPVIPGATGERDQRVFLSVEKGAKPNKENRIPLNAWIVDPAKMPRQPTYRLQRGDTLAGVARKFHVTPKSLLVANAKTGPSDLHRGEVVRIPNTFDVMVNNERVAFDVNPRIENGLPLAPFRQIFEHAGGVVFYDAAQHEVNASSDTKQVKIRIGSKEAIVNQSIVVLDRAAFIDSGRTIVPMAFMQKAMDLRAEYDVKTKTIILVHR